MEPVQVTTKNPKKVENGKRLAEYNRKKREELKQRQTSSNILYKDNTSYIISGVITISLLGGIIYYFRKNKTSEKNIETPEVRNSKFEMN